MYDILIVGSGGAAQSAALMAKSLGAKVVVVSEGYPTRSQTCMAQGGINAVIDSGDSIDAHIQDTLKSSKSLGDKDMISKLCNLAPDTIEWLNSIGVPFSRRSDGKVAQRKLGGASFDRACYSQDYTGLKILHTLYDQCLKEEIEFLNEHHLLDLNVVDGRVVGANFLQLRSGKVVSISSKTTILATGGYAGIYKHHTTNTNYSTGDGLAVAYRAGAELSNLEFIQFHPTALKGSGTLISESARGAGAKLLNQKGERFVDELKPRDEVSLAIKQELDRGGEVFLDMRELGEEFIDENLPQERKLCISYVGLDPATELIPIIPAAHYSMGGVAVDESFMSSIDGLFAVGECSNSRVHGANRLGGNSLLEIVAFGRECAKSAYEFAKNIAFDKLDQIDSNLLDDIFENEPEIDFYKEQKRLSRSIYNKLGIIRSKDGIDEVLDRIELIKKDLPKMGIVDKGRVYNTNLLEFLKFKNMLLLSELIAKSALVRKESRGAFIRSDYQEMSEKFAKDTIVSKDGIWI